MSASPAPALLPSAVDLWRHQLAALPAERSPGHYLITSPWAEMRAACLASRDRFGD